MSIIIINRSRVRGQLEVIDNPVNEIYNKLDSDCKDRVEVIRNKGPKETTAEDWKALLDICKSLE